MKMIAGSLIAVLLAAGAAAHAQITPCPVETGEAHAVSFEDKKQDNDFLRAMSVSFNFGLAPKSFPFKSINLDDTCTRGTFDSGDQTFGVYGGVGDSPPRWSVSSDRKRVIFLAIIPPLAASQAWINDPDRNTHGLSFKGDALYALAITNGDLREIYGVFDALPGDAQLIGLFRDAAGGRLPLLARFDEATHQTDYRFGVP